MKKLRRFYAFVVFVIVLTSFIIVSCVVLMLRGHFELIPLFISLFMLLICLWVIVFIKNPPLNKILKCIKDDIDKQYPESASLRKTLDEIRKQVDEFKITIEELNKHREESRRIMLKQQKKNKKKIGYIE